MNSTLTEREHRLALALAEELALVVGTLLNRQAAARDVREADGSGSGSGWLLRWRLGGALSGSLTATIDEKAAGEFVGQLSGPAAPNADETVAGGLRDLAGQVAGGLNRNPAAEGAFVTSDGSPALDVLEPGATTMTFDITTADGVLMTVTCCAALDEASSGAADGRRAWMPNAARDAGAPAAAPANLGVILDLDLPLVVRFAQTSLTLQALSRLGPGLVLDLDRSPEDAVDVLVNGVAIARGEVVVVGGNYGVRITEVMNAVERIRVMAS